MRFFHIFSVASLTLLAFWLRLYHLGTPSLWYDELLQLDIAQDPFSEIWGQLNFHAAMPLDYYLLHLWLQFGRQELWVRLPACISGTLTIPLIYTFATRLFDPWVGYTSATLFTLSSFSVSYSQEVRPYALLTLLVLLSCYRLWSVYQSKRPSYWLLVALGLIGAVFSHYFALFMLLPLSLFVGGQHLWHAKIHDYWKHSFLFALLLVVLFGSLVIAGRLNVLNSVSYRFTNSLLNPDTLTLPRQEKPNRGPGPAIERQFFINKVLTPLGNYTTTGLLVYNLFYLLSVLSLLNPYHKQRSSLIFLLSWHILPIILIYLFLLHRGTFFAIRYILYTLPAYLIIVAYGLQLCVQSLFSFVSQPRQTLYFSLGSLLLLIPFIYLETHELRAYYHSPAYEDWRSVGQLLQANAQPNDAVIAIRAESSLNWYYPPAEAPLNHYWNNDRVHEAINQHPRRWFVLSSYSRRYDKGIRDWLTNHEAIRIEIDRRVVVYFHQKDLTKAEMLAQIKIFILPPNRAIYLSLAKHFFQQGDRAFARTLLEQGEALPDLTDISLNVRRQK